ncbi:MAG: outer membrane protein assembly factor BamE [Proteobacteria bacterium]|nr:outer membrane protein assembly factor BamE [Pseudomonadota bacterium]
MKKSHLLTCAAVAALLLPACTPTKAVRGNMVEDFRLTEVQKGVDTESDILRKLGSPTTKAPFDDRIWYYMGQETEKRGILDPEVKKERVVIVAFDDAGTVMDIQDIQGRRNEVPYVRRKTPTTGNEITVMQQLLGNMGKFNKNESSAVSTAGSGPP